MNQLLTALVLIVAFSSCQKEISFDAPTSPSNGNPGAGNPGTGSSGGNLLVKVVAVTGSETTTTLYGYDASERLSTITIDGVSGGMPVHSYQKFERDAAGRIVKILQKLADVGGVPSDTAKKIVHYPDATTMKYDYSIHVMGMSVGQGLPPMQTIDSNVYHYTGGKLGSYDSYMASSLLPGSTLMRSRYDFMYDPQNRVAAMKMYSDVSSPGGPLSLMADWTYTYGSTINGIYVSPDPAQNLLLHGLPNTGTSNVDKMLMHSGNPQLDLTVTTSYVAGANGRPVSATAVSTTTGVQNQTQTTKYTFFYQ